MDDDDNDINNKNNKNLHLRYWVEELIHLKLGDRR